MPMTPILPLPAAASKVQADTPTAGVGDQELYDRITRDIEDAESARTRWDTKMDLYHRLRMRVRKTKAFPFPGASNLRMPTAEKWVRKVVSARLQQAWGIKPKAVVVPQAIPRGLDVAPRVERLLDWQFEQQIPDALETLTITADKAAEQGFSCLSPVWHMESTTDTAELSVADLEPHEVLELFGFAQGVGDMARWLFRYWDVDLSETVLDENLEEVARAAAALATGAASVTVTLKDELYNGPLWRLFPAEYVIVPADARLNPRHLRWFALERYEPLAVLRQMAKAGQIEQEALDWVEVSGSLDADRLTSAEKDLREGILRLNNPSRLVLVQEWYGWVETEPGVLQKQWALLAPEFHTFLKKPTKLWADHRQWPLVRFNNEVTDDRWYSSRGWPELLEDIIKEIDTQHNQKLDQQTVRNAPMFAFRAGVVNPRLVRFVPAQAIPVPGGTPLDDAVKLLNNTNLNAEFSYEREEMLLKTEVQELVGHIDYSLQSTINRREPRTAAEVNQAAYAAGQVATLDAMLWAESLSELFTQTLQLDQQYLPERVYVTVSGGPGEQTLNIRRDEIQGKMVVRARGSEAHTNPAIREQRAQTRIALLATPYNLQAGIVTPQHVFNLYRRLLEEQGEVAWQLYIQPPPPPPPVQPPPAITLIKPDFDSLTPAEQMQVLVTGGIQPDVRGRALSQELEIVDKMEDAVRGNGRATPKPRRPAR